MGIDAVKFKNGDILYRRIKPDEAIQIVGIIFTPNGVMYQGIDENGSTASYYECELTYEKNFATKE